jgi:hypothetical protein
MSMDGFAEIGQKANPDLSYISFEGPQWIMSTQSLAEFPRQVNPNTTLLTQIHVKVSLMLHSPSAAEISTMENAAYVEFALTQGEHAMILSHRFDDGLWVDGSWQAVLQARGEIPAGLPGGDGHLAVWMPMIDADSGVIRTQKLTSWPPPFVAAVRDAIRAQNRNARQLSSPEAANAAGAAEITHWTETHPTPEELVENAATIIVRGGRDSRIIRDRR